MCCIQFPWSLDFLRVFKTSFFALQQIVSPPFALLGTYLLSWCGLWSVAIRSCLVLSLCSRSRTKWQQTALLVCCYLLLLFYWLAEIQVTSSSEVLLVSVTNLRRNMLEFCCQRGAVRVGWRWLGRLQLQLRLTVFVARVWSERKRGGADWEKSGQTAIC